MSASAFSRRALLRSALPMLASAALPGLAFAQGAYPTRPVRVLIGTPAGDSADIGARQLCERLQALLGQPFYVENKPGAHGFIVAGAIKAAPADGSTLLYSSGGQMAVNPALYGKKLPYDPLKDLEPIVLLQRAPMYLYVDARLPIKDVKEWIGWTKAQGGKVSYGSGGAGSTQHLAMELLKRTVGIEATHVPYRGTPMVLQDVIGGQLPFALDALASIQSQAKAGRIRIIAVAGAQRSPLTPDVPTFGEQGVAGFEPGFWTALYAPAGTPAPIVQRLNETANGILKEPAFIEQVRASGGGIPAGGTPEDLRRTMVTEIARWTAVVKQAGIQPE